MKHPVTGTASIAAYAVFTSILFCSEADAAPKAPRPTRKTVWSPSAGFVYGFDNSDNDIDVTGIALKYGVYADDRSTFEDAKLVPEVFINTIFAYGNEGSTDYRKEETDCTGRSEIFLVTHGIGIAMRVKFYETFSVFVRGEGGICAAWSKFSEDGRHHHECDADVGTVLHLGAGLQIDPAEHHSFTVSLGYLTTTTETKAAGDNADALKYTTLSLGYRFSF